MAAASGLLMLPITASIAAASDRKALSFVHTHTLEELSLTFAENGRYVPDALGALNLLLRDHRSDESCPMDPKLFDMLHSLQVRAGTAGPFEIISAYRSPATNAMLRKKSKGVAKRSFHMQGRAVDVRLRGFDTVQLRQAALDLELGGVGYYAKSDFLHLDTGTFRTW
ncbi:MAG: DUF882 domain-containing protein [Gammaproteobacteria bacterium]